MKNRKFVNGVNRYEFVNIDEILSVREGYNEYRYEFEKSLKMQKVNKPMYIVLEVNNYCNMRCKMCPHSMYENANGHENMSIEVFDRILEEANEMGVSSFFLGGGTECLINPEIVTMIKHVKEIGRGIDDVIITNGYCLTDEIIDLLIDLQWEKLFISLDAATDETYKKIRGNDLKVVESNIDRLIKRKKERNSMFPLVRVSFCVQEDNVEEKELFFEKWKNKVDIIDYQDLVHMEDLNVECDLPETDRRCIEPFNRLMINCKGIIMPCCTLGWCEKIPLGNISSMSIKQAWNSTIITDLREGMISGKINDVCKSCLKNTEE